MFERKDILISRSGTGYAIPRSQKTTMDSSSDDPKDMSTRQAESYAETIRTQERLRYAQELLSDMSSQLAVLQRENGVLQGENSSLKRRTEEMELLLRQFQSSIGPSTAMQVAPKHTSVVSSPNLAHSPQIVQVPAHMVAAMRNGALSMADVAKAASTSGAIKTSPNPVVSTSSTPAAPIVSIESPSTQSPRPVPTRSNTPSQLAPAKQCDVRHNDMIPWLVLIQRKWPEKSLCLPSNIQELFSHGAQFFLTSVLGPAAAAECLELSGRQGPCIPSILATTFMEWLDAKLDVESVLNGFKKYTFADPMPLSEGRRSAVLKQISALASNTRKMAQVPSVGLHLSGTQTLIGTLRSEKTGLRTWFDPVITPSVLEKAKSNIAPNNLQSTPFQQCCPDTLSLLECPPPNSLRSEESSSASGCSKSNKRRRRCHDSPNQATPSSSPQQFKSPRVEGKRGCEFFSSCSPIIYPIMTHEGQKHPLQTLSYHAVTSTVASQAVAPSADEIENNKDIQPLCEKRQEPIQHEAKHQAEACLHEKRGAEMPYVSSANRVPNPVVCESSVLISEILSKKDPSATQVDKDASSSDDTSLTTAAKGSIVHS
ncbi:hypothetical protein SeLEV6574_g00626 [Synchytrium endobioticum]|uniref:Uncharacterized protein n=1 Tax=Synchytrium endobioticum TaxID=286115 RepID=A0A507DJ17_9FUNG|nr:hypothetical protein SeLEV6574_g00626 [Synchytrium endobioticum]